MSLADERAAERRSLKKTLIYPHAFLHFSFAKSNELAG